MRRRQKSHFIYRAICILFIVFSYLSCNVGIIYSEETLTEQESIQQYNAKDSIVQVVLLYQDENMIYHILQSGSGILVDETTVITNNHLTVMSEDLKNASGAYLSQVLGHPVSFTQTEDNSVEVSSYSLAVVQEADIFNMATVKLSSNDWDFAILALTNPMTREIAVLGDSDQITIEQEMSVLGYPTVSYADAKSFSINDVSMTSGQCVSLEGGNVNFDAHLEAGSTGGALVDTYGRVIGIAIYQENGTGTYTALPINRIKDYLEQSGTAYKEDLSVFEITDESNIEPENTFVTDKRDLYRVITEAQLIYDDGNEGIYTEESFRNLELYLSYAKITYEDNVASQDIIDEDTENLRTAIDSLEKIEKKNTAKLVIIIVGTIILTAGITVLIICLIIRCKEKQSVQKNKQKIKAMEPIEPIEKNILGGKQEENKALDMQPEQSKKPGNQMSYNSIASVGTTVLRVDSYNETTILNDREAKQIKGYLYRSSTGESILIQTEVFFIGKNDSEVDYTIYNNTNISRIHAKIILKCGVYFIEDMNSTNYTYVNGLRVAPGYQQVLQNKDIIYLADEEFVFFMQ